VYIESSGVNGGSREVLPGGYELQRKQVLAKDTRGGLDGRKRLVARRQKLPAEGNRSEGRAERVSDCEDTTCNVRMERGTHRIGKKTGERGQARLGPESINRDGERVPSV
jgi:hypothetical protein